MNRDYLVSVIIPAHNAGEYVRDCLEAVIHQTYSNIEIVLINNGSQDTTGAIFKEYAEKDSRIKFYSLENNGVSDARNYGISKAEGDYIVFFDADDRPELDIIECYLNALEQWKGKKVAFICCGMFYDNLLNKNVDNKVVLLEKYHGFIEGENYLLKRNFASTLAWLKIFNFVTNKIYDLGKIIDYGIRFDEDVNIGEDLKFNLDYLEACTGYIGMVNKPLYHYIKRSNNSLSLTYHENDIEDTKTIYRRFIDWETGQKDVTYDQILVIKGIYITDWTSRLATMYDYYQGRKMRSKVRKALNSEIRSSEYQGLLKQVYKGKKISTIRYLALRSRNFGIFCMLRSLYQLTKG